MYKLGKIGNSIIMRTFFGGLTMLKEFPVANLSEKQLQDVKNLEVKLKTADSGQETILIAYAKES